LRLRQQPRYAGLRDLEQPRTIRSALLPRDNLLHNFPALMLVQLWRPAADASLASRLSQTGERTLPQHRALEFGEHANHLHHGAAREGLARV